MSSLFKDVLNLKFEFIMISCGDIWFGLLLIVFEDVKLLECFVIVDFNGGEWCEFGEFL